MPGFSTTAIHAGQEPEPRTGAVTVPIFQTTTYAQHTLGEHVKYDYARTINPTREAWETSIAALENGTHGFAFASGMSAIAAALSLVKPGSHIIAGSDMYGGTYRYLSKILSNYGVDVSYIHMSPTGADSPIGDLQSPIQKNTTLIYAETPTNPMMNLTDLGALGQLARERGIMTIVDNTFMSPYLQNPLDFGIDIVVHSATKYIGGHSDVIGGALVTSSSQIAEQIKFYQNAYGAIPAPFDCWLMLRSVKTLALRMRAHCENAQIIAERLASDERVTKVYYPGLPSHPQHKLALEQMKGFGGMVSVELGNLERARKFTSALRYFTLGESLGGVESLVCHPLTMTHASVPEARRLELGITEGLVRLSVGIEDICDLLEDVARTKYIMRRSFLFLLFLLISCGGKPSLNFNDMEYVRTTLDLLRTRANFSPTEDSTSIKRSLDSVYRRHRTSAAEYQAQTLSFSDDHDRVSAIFAAINDSIGK